MLSSTTSPIILSRICPRDLLEFYLRFSLWISQLIHHGISSRISKKSYPRIISKISTIFQNIFEVFLYVRFRRRYLQKKFKNVIGYFFKKFYRNSTKVTIWIFSGISKDFFRASCKDFFRNIIGESFKTQTFFYEIFLKLHQVMFTSMPPGLPSTIPLGFFVFQVSRIPSGSSPSD